MLAGVRGALSPLSPRAHHRYKGQEVAEQKRKLLTTTTTRCTGHVDTRHVRVLTGRQL